jgi:hypothetical protein
MSDLNENWKTSIYTSSCYAYRQMDWGDGKAILTEALQGWERAQKRNLARIVVGCIVKNGLL